MSGDRFDFAAGLIVIRGLSSAGSGSLTPSGNSLGLDIRMGEQHPWMPKKTGQTVEVKLERRMKEWTCMDAWPASIPGSQRFWQLGLLLAGQPPR